MITISVDGTQYQNFESLTVSKSIDSFSGTFDFSATQDVNTPFPFKTGGEVSVFLGNQRIISGYINKILIRYSAKDHTIQIIGRDKTQDLIDSQLPENFKFNGPITFESIITETINRLGIENLAVENLVSPTPTFDSTDVINGKQGQTAFDFLETYARKLNVILTSNGNGDVVITRAATQSLSTSLQLKVNSNDNNILDANIIYDDSNRFNRYISKSQSNFASALAANDPDSAFATNQSGEATDPDIRSGRIYTLINESAGDNDDTINRAQWEANLRRSNSLKYVVTVSGFYTTPEQNEFWQINRLVQVNDVFAGINSIMLINAVTYTTDVVNGNIARLELVTPDSYTLQAQLSNQESLANNLGDIYI